MTENKKDSEQVKQDIFNGEVEQNTNINKTNIEQMKQNVMSDNSGNDNSGNEMNIEQNESPKPNKIQNIKSKLNSKILKIVFVVFLILIICVLVYVIYYLNKHRPNVDVDLLNQTKEAYAKLLNEHTTLKNKCKFLEQQTEKLKDENEELVSELNNSIMKYDEPLENNTKPKKFKEKKAEIYKAYSTSQQSMNKKNTKKHEEKKKKEQDINELVEDNKEEENEEDLNNAVDSIIN